MPTSCFIQIQDGAPCVSVRLEGAEFLIPVRRVATLWVEGQIGVSSLIATPDERASRMSDTDTDTDRIPVPVK
jgi:hypothetical protein